MTDLYLRREKPSKRPIVIAVVLIVLIAAGILIYNLQHRPAPVQAVAESVEAMADRLESPFKAPPADQPAEPVKPAVAAPAHPPPTVSPGELSTARRLADEGKLLEAREACWRILDSQADETVLAATRKLISEVNTQLVFSPHDMPEKTLYVVQAGDSLDRIARKHGTSVELLQKSNDIRGSLIHPGDRLRVLNGDFSVVINKTKNYLYVYLNNKFFKAYRVGTGEFGKTPVGDFKITDKIVHPPWWRPDGKQIPYGDPANLLGTHWLSLNVRGYGIHGTWEPDTIGRQSSAGCVRLLNEDIEELYALLPVGTAVTIEE